MAEAHPRLKARLWTRRNIKAIEDTQGKSVLRVLSSSPEGKSGYSANFIACDELADWGSHARDVWDQLAYATAARRNALQFVISTAQFDKATVGYEQYQYAKRVQADPALDPTFYPVVYEVGEHDDWRDPEQWWRANPSAGYTVPHSYYHDQFREVENNPLNESRFRTLLLNQWTGSAQQWIASNLWAECGSDFAEDSLYGCEAVAGLDMARRFDNAAYAILVERDGLLYVIVRTFIPADIAREKERTDNVPYQAWAKNPRNGLHLTPGDVIDPGYIRAELLKDAERFKFQSVGFDPWAAEETRQILEHEHGLPMVEVPQSFKVMAPVTSHFERLCIGHKIRHPRSAVLDWNLGNCVPKEWNGQVMIDKARCRARIDGIAATLTALQRHMSLNAEPEYIRPDALLYF